MIFKYKPPTFNFQEQFAIFCGALNLLSDMGYAFQGKPLDAILWSIADAIIFLIVWKVIHLW